MNNLSIGTAISILVIVLAIISIGCIILAFEACPSQALNFSNNGSEEALDRTKIGDILANPAKYQFDLVTVIGEYRGWQGEGIAPPITYSDWVIKDDTGLIYVTGLLPGFDPVEDIGLILEVSGMVGVKEGAPYIEAKNIKLFNETKIGDILANPAKYQFGLVTVIGEYRGWQGEGTAPPVTYSDWVIKDDTGLIYVTGLLPGFDPVEDIGLILEVSGMGRVKEGEPYIEAKSVKIFNETKIGDILANPAKYQFGLVTVIGEYRGWQGEETTPPITKSDWVIKDDTGLIYVTGLLPGFDPVEDIGLILEVSGMVRVKEGEPYIEAKSVKLFNETKIGDILANPAKYQFGLVTVIGEYQGWQGEGTAPPITKSDWVIKDDTGLIYVTGLLPGFDPVEDIGLILEVSGMVRVKEGEPYIEAKSVKLFNETKIGDILANPAKYQFGLVTVIGEYRGWQGEGIAPPITYSDWVIKDDTGLIYVTGLLPGFDPVEDIGLILEVSGLRSSVWSG